MVNLYNGVDGTCIEQREAVVGGGRSSDMKGKNRLCITWMAVGSRKTQYWDYKYVIHIIINKPRYPHI